MLAQFLLCTCWLRHACIFGYTNFLMCTRGTIIVSTSRDHMRNKTDNADRVTRHNPGLSVGRCRGHCCCHRLWSLCSVAASPSHSRSLSEGVSKGVWRYGCHMCAETMTWWGPCLRFKVEWHENTVQTKWSILRRMTAQRGHPAWLHIEWAIWRLFKCCLLSVSCPPWNSECLHFSFYSTHLHPTPSQNQLQNKENTLYLH